MAHEVQVKGRSPEEIKAYEEKRKKEDIEKKEKEKKFPPKKEKQYFDVKMECLVPCTLSFRVLAEDENEAIKLAEKSNPRHFQPSINRRRNIKATVYEAGMSIIKFAKNYRF